MKTVGFVKGHALRSEGRPYERVPGISNPYRHQRVLRGYADSRKGRALCTCGLDSDVLTSDYGRKQWHRDHKLEVLARG